MPQKKKVLLLVPEISQSAQELFWGIAAHERTHALQWILRACECDAKNRRLITKFSADGIIMVGSPDRFLPRGKPILRIAAENAHISLDEEAHGRLAAQHIIERGYQRAAVIFDPSHLPSARRIEGFCELVAEHRLPLHALEIAGSTSPWLRNSMSMRQETRLRQWLRDLPKPTAIFCATEIQAQAIQMVCLELGIQVPAEVGVVGIGNCENNAQLHAPRTSLVYTDFFEIGRYAAACLTRMMEEPGWSPALKKIKPSRLLESESTQVFGAGDTEVSRCIQYIRQHCHENLRVAHLLKQVSCCRSILERKFRATRGHSPLTEIHHWKLEKVKELLMSSNLSMGQIADASGFADSFQLSSFFHKKTGLRPTEYRKKQAALGVQMDSRKDAANFLN